MVADPRHFYPGDNVILYFQDGDVLSMRQGKLISYPGAPGSLIVYEDYHGKAIAQNQYAPNFIRMEKKL